MASSRFLISSQTLASAAATVTFSSIPATYTDLSIKCSVRNTTSGNTVSDFWVKFNGLTGSIYSRTRLQGNGAAAASDRTASTSIDNFENMMNGGSSTSNTFSNVDIYIPNYAGSTTKPHSMFGAMENNATTAYIAVQANLIPGNTDAISSMIFTSGSDNFAIGSSFYLYGLKAS
jgi:hypothetical protein